MESKRIEKVREKVEYKFGGKREAQNREEEEVRTGVGK